MRVIYPQPTMWSSHELIPLTSNGRRLLDALKDADIARMGWERHGFRSNLAGAIDTTATRIAGVPRQIESVVPMPGRPVMEKLLADLQKGGTATTTRP